MSTDRAATLREARAAYFVREQLGADGGYSAKWVRFRIGPITVPFPNSTARRRALPLHDLHHIATGYDTSWTGEAQIAAWELGSGCGRYVAAWLLNLAALPIGLFIAPRRTWRAFVRGRRSGSLYTHAWDERWLDSSVSALRERLGLTTTAHRATAADAMLFGACVVPAALLVMAIVLGARALWSLSAGWLVVTTPEH